jgi:hypothetical protein
MGGGVSQLITLAQNDPKLFEQFRNAFAEVFAKEFERSHL